MNKELQTLCTINYWESAPNFQLGFLRETYHSQLWNIFGNKLIKVIVGQRRVGKSVIVRQIIHKLITEKKLSPKNIFYLNKEMYEFENISTANDLYEIIQLYKSTYKPKGKIYLFIDEIQNIDNWEKLIVSLAQHPIEDYEITVTGSNSRLLSGELASMLSGRYIVIEVFPFSYKEYLAINRLKNAKENFIEYIKTTGLPEKFNFTSNDTIVHYFQALKNTILLKDIMYRHKIRDYILLEDIFLFLLHNVGNLTSIPSIIKYYKSKNRKADYTTISQYISYMQDCFIIHEVPRISKKTKELLAGEKKYYVNDLGFRNYLYPSLNNDIGSMLENVVYMHLRMAGYKVNVMAEKNFEVDFVAENKKSKHYVQVAYLIPTTNTANREFYPLEKIDDNLPKTVVSMDDILLHHQKGIMHKHVWDYIYEIC